jgi:putative nucleotidyltransferase with HDIG domain
MVDWDEESKPGSIKAVQDGFEFLPAGPGDGEEFSEQVGGTRAGPEAGPLLVHALFSISKMVKIYELDNNTVKRGISELLQLLQRIFSSQERAVLRIASECLILNDERIPMSSQSFGTFQYLMDEMKKREVESIEFFPGVDERELGIFMKIFHEIEESKEPFDSMEERREHAKIRHIAITQLIEMQRRLRDYSIDLQDVKLESNRIYFRTVALMREVVRGIEQLHSIQVKKATRLTQQMVDIMQTDESILLGLASIKNFDEYTFTHSVNVCVLSMAMGDKLRLCKSDIARLGLAALFHDIGKVYIPLTIVNNPNKLEGRDWELMKYHTFFGVKELSKVKSIQEMTDAMFVSLQHHVHYDMNGYPQKKTGWDLRLFTRIVTIADYYDAMTSPRVYRPSPLRPDKVLSFILQKSGRIFDPFLAKIFIKSMGVYPVGTLVELDDGTRAIVIKQNDDPRFLAKPYVKLIPEESTDKENRVVDLSEKKGSFSYEHTITKVIPGGEFAAEKNASFLAE